MTPRFRLPYIWLGYPTTFRRLWLAQFGHCPLCGKPLLLEGQAHSKDHVLPRSKGGKRPNNIVLVHSRCNSLKNDRHPTPCEQLFARITYEILEFIPEQFWNKHIINRKALCGDANAQSWRNSTLRQSRQDQGVSNVL